MSNVADRVLIATDPDREGEAIAAHLQQIPKKNWKGFNLQQSSWNPWRN